MVCIKALRSCEEPGNDEKGARVNSKLLIAGQGASETLLGCPSPFPESGPCVPLSWSLCVEGEFHTQEEASIVRILGAGLVPPPPNLYFVVGFLSSGPVPAAGLWGHAASWAHTRTQAL